MVASLAPSTRTKVTSSPAQCSANARSKAVGEGTTTRVTPPWPVVDAAEAILRIKPGIAGCRRARSANVVDV